MLPIIINNHYCWRIYSDGIGRYFQMDIVDFIVSKQAVSVMTLKDLCDRGCQYCSNKYHKIIKQHKFRGSMSRRGNCFDNAPIESFWGVLKNELVYHQDYKTRFRAISDITKYIELDYNQTRIQKGLGYKTPRQIWFDFYRQAA